MQKDNYELKINELKDLVGKYQLDGEICELDRISDDIKKFRLKILLVGGFSAGKSALINTFLDRDLLTEGQRPETAIASEIVYDTVEYIEAVYEKGIDRYEIEKLGSIDVDKYEYLICHINNSALYDIKDYTFVDMPGFNSGIKNHNKAILRYASQANSYILVIDCEDGEIKQSINDFINEIKNYDNNLAIAISKSDLKTPEDLALINDRISSTAAMMFGQKINTVNLSKFEDDTKQKLESLVKGFDTEEIFTQTYRPRIYEMGLKFINSLECIKANSQLNIAEFKTEIAKREKAKKELSSKLENEKKKLARRFQSNVKPSIISDIENALYQQSDTLASSLISGGNNFSMVVNNILRPVLVTSVQKYTEQSFDEFLGEIDFGGSVASGDLDGLCGDMLKKYQDANGKIQTIAQSADKFNGVYKTITTALAITTTVVAPWLELILIFLPDIIKLFGGMNQKSQQDQIKSKVTREIIPQISSRLAPEIENSLNELQDEMIEQIEQKIGALLDVEAEALEKAMEMKAEQEKDYNEKVKKIEGDINIIKGIIEFL